MALCSTFLRAGTRLSDVTALSAGAPLTVSSSVARSTTISAGNGDIDKNYVTVPFSINALPLDCRKK